MVALFAFSACHRPEPAPDNQVFRYNEAGNLLSLDPAFARLQSGVWACRQVFSGLVRLDTNAHVIPEIAKRWEISPDGRDYTFILRDDVRFHKSEAFLPQYPDSTRTVNAHDFVYSLGRLTDTLVTSPGAWTMNYVETIDAPNDTTLHIRLREPFPAFMSLLTMPYCMVVPREAVEYLGEDFRTRPVGTGAFYVKYWSEGNMLVLRRNPDFFEYDSAGVRLPYLEAINITFLPDKQSAFMEFLMGNLDFISGLDPGYADEVLTSDGRLKEKFEGQIAMMTMPYLNTEYLGIKMDLPQDHPLSDLRIRRALNHGFDRRKMMLYLRKNIGIPATGGMIPLGLDGTLASDSVNLYDPELSLRLIEEYKREKGPIKPFVLQVNSDYRDLCEYIQSEWQRLGIPVSVEVIQTASLRQAMATGKSDFFRASLGGRLSRWRKLPLALLRTERKPQGAELYALFQSRLRPSVPRGGPYARPLPACHPVPPCRFAGNARCAGRGAVLRPGDPFLQSRLAEFYQQHHHQQPGPAGGEQGINPGGRIGGIPYFTYICPERTKTNKIQEQYSYYVEENHWSRIFRPGVRRTPGGVLGR